MCDAAGELADRLHLLGLAKLFFGCPPLGQIASDLGEADQLAGAVVDRIDDYVRPEPGPVLAHPPSLGLVFAGASRGLQRRLRQPPLLVLLRIKSGEMTPDNLFGGVAFDPRGA